MIAVMQTNGAPQQLQWSQPGSCAQLPMMLGAEMGVIPQVWQSPQPPTLWSSATAQQHIGNFSVQDATQTCPPVFATGFDYSASALGWPNQSFSLPCAHSMEPSLQLAGFMPVYSATLPTTSVALMPFASNYVDFGSPDCQETPSPDSEDSTPSETFLCTPELTPRYRPRTTPEQEHADCKFSLPVGLQPNILVDVANQLANLPDHVECREPDSDQDSSEDEFDVPKCGNPADHIIEVEWRRCWDMIPRDLTKSSASSETSTVVSRSARRRRGRRSSKAKTSETSMPISQSPNPDDLLVLVEKKDELIHMLSFGGDLMHEAVSSLRGSVLRMSLEPFGCRVVQAALEHASTAEKECIVAELRGHVRLAITSPHANFVLQRAIEMLPVNSTSFVAAELASGAGEVAKHRFGCRVLSRLIEHHLGGNAAPQPTNDLIDELLLEADQLINHNFARHVLDLILEHGRVTHKQKIAEVVRNNLFQYAKNRNASYVVEKAFTSCMASDTHAIATELLSDPQCFLTLAVHECGTHVVKAVVNLHGDCASKAKKLLLANVDRVKSSKYGKRLLDEM